ncbi:hypothetical protein HID58_080748 [Brassica napus]|uniref:Uncharacterized protein n=1 Tax=Brassica napus TaxID=3708 RepID=A0ABQ7Y5R8_BRANA|nr:hypothetical protein HID58_080748 [Brassica napus]
MERSLKPLGGMVARGGVCLAHLCVMVVVLSFMASSRRCCDFPLNQMLSSRSLFLFFGGSVYCEAYPNDMGIPGIRGNEENLTFPWSPPKVENIYVVPRVIKSGLAECAGFGGRAKIILTIFKLGFEIDLVIQTVSRFSG